jgi:hypothetical protein
MPFVIVEFAISEWTPFVGTVAAGDLPGRAPANTAGQLFARLGSLKVDVTPEVARYSLQAQCSLPVQYPFPVQRSLGSMQQLHDVDTLRWVTVKICR